MYNVIDLKSIKNKAILILDKRIDYLDGSILEMVIWKLPSVTQARPHGFKYRFNYSLLDGTTLVRYDNKIGKGDHKHIKDTEHSYKFTCLEQAVIDFLNDIKNNGGFP